MRKFWANYVWEHLPIMWEKFGKLVKFWTSDEEILSKLGKYLLKNMKKSRKTGKILIKWENFEQIMGTLTK